MRRSDLPHLLGDDFTIGQARDAGVSLSRLRARDLVIPYRGLRSRAAADVPDPGLDTFQRLRAEVLRNVVQYACVMPANQFFSHVTAALIWDLPLPASLLLPRADGTSAHSATLDVGVYGPLRHPRVTGVRGHQVRSAASSLRTHPATGVRVTSPASTWAMLGAILRDPYDLVAVGDAVVREPMFQADPPPLAAFGQLEAAVSSGRRVGVNQLRAALPRIRTRSASRPESWVRLTIIDAGMPDPELNWEVFDDRGAFLACVDLAYPRLKVAIEYEGEHHLTDPLQWAKDIARHERLVENGWIVVRVTKEHLFERSAHMAERVRRAIRSRS